VNRLNILPILFVQFLFSQVSIGDINNISNQALDKIREELQQKNQQNPAVQNVVELSPEIVTIDPLIQDSDKSIDYFGYDYFRKDISFFDNVPTSPDYRLGPGDEIIISLWGETNYRSSMTIDKEGLIYFENIGFINLSNLTLDSAEQHLRQSLSKIYATLNSDNNSTKLSLSLGKLKSMNVYFSGQIENPGMSLVHPFSDIFSAIIQVGGININGSLREVQLIRNNKIIQTIDFYAFFMDGKNNFSQQRVLEGDVIHVPKIQKRVRVAGAVNRPSYYELLPNESIKELIEFAVGLTSNASSNIFLTQVVPVTNREADDYAIKSKIIQLDDMDSIYLNDGDSIEIKKISGVINTVNISGKVKSPGLYPIPASSSLKDVLELAGGFNDPNFKKSINLDKILILRKDSNQYYSREYTVSYESSNNFKLEVNDQIFVYSNTIYDNLGTFTILGEVFYPGTYHYSNNFSLADAVNKAGGFTENAFPEAISLNSNFINYSENQNVNISGIDLKTIITPGSVIEVPKKTFSFQVAGNVYSPGYFVSSKKTRISDAIILAGGLKPKTLKNKIYIIRSNGKIEKVRGALSRRTKIINWGDTLVVPENENPKDFDISAFVSDITLSLTNLAAILVLVENLTNN